MTDLWQHPLPTRLHAQTSVMHKQYEVRPLPIPTLTLLRVRLLVGRFRDVAIEAYFNGHATRITDIGPCALVAMS